MTGAAHPGTAGPARPPRAPVRLGRLRRALEADGFCDTCGRGAPPATAAPVTPAPPAPSSRSARRPGGDRAARRAHRHAREPTRDGPGRGPDGASHRTPRRGHPDRRAVERTAVHRPGRRRCTAAAAPTTSRPCRASTRPARCCATPTYPSTTAGAATAARPTPSAAAVTGGQACCAGSARRTARGSPSPRRWRRGRWSPASTRCAARWPTAGSAGSTSRSTATSTTGGWCSRASSTRTTRPHSPPPAPSGSSWPSSATPTSSGSTTSSATSNDDGAWPADYIVMAYIGGSTLAQVRDARAAEGALPVAHALTYMIKVLPALGYLHAEGHVYSDFKPDNVMQCERHLTLIDMGAVARIDDADAVVYGTVGYHAPEVVRAELSPASDLYTVGRTLAVLALGIEPARDGVATELPDDHPLLQRHESLHRLLLRATHPDPLYRFGSADEMAEQLDGVRREVLAVDEQRPRPAPSAVFSPPRGTFAPGLLLPDTETGPAGPGRPDRRAAARATRRRPDRSRRLAPPLVRGARGLSTGDLDTARAAFDALYSTFPGELAPKLALAAVAECAGDDDSARRYYELVATVDPSWADAAFGLARTWLRAGRRADAVAALLAVPTSSSGYVAAQRAAVEATLLRHDAGSADDDELRAAAALLQQLDLDPLTMQRLRVAVLDAAVERAGAGAGEPVLGCPWEERALRLELERSLRAVPADPGPGGEDRARRPGQRRAPLDPAVTGVHIAGPDAPAVPCPRCGTPPVAGDHFCEVCGADLRAQRAARAPRTVRGGTRLFPDDDGWCPSCGAEPARRHGPRRDRRGRRRGDQRPRARPSPQRGRGRAGPGRSRLRRRGRRGWRRPSATACRPPGRPNSPHARPPTPRSRPAARAGHRSSGSHGGRRAPQESGASGAPSSPPRPLLPRLVPRGTPEPPSCTLVCAVHDVSAGVITVGWVGDSRAYWLAEPTPLSLPGCSARTTPPRRPPRPGPWIQPSPRSAPTPSPAGSARTETPSRRSSRSPRAARRAPALHRWALEVPAGRRGARRRRPSRAAPRRRPGGRRRPHGCRTGRRGADTYRRRAPDPRRRRSHDSREHRRTRVHRRGRPEPLPCPRRDARRRRGHRDRHGHRRHPRGRLGDHRRRRLRVDGRREDPLGPAGDCGSDRRTARRRRVRGDRRQPPGAAGLPGCRHRLAGRRAAHRGLGAARHRRHHRPARRPGRRLPRADPRRDGEERARTVAAAVDAAGRDGAVRQAGRARGRGPDRPPRRRRPATGCLPAGCVGRGEPRLSRVRGRAARGGERASARGAGRAGPRRGRRPGLVPMGSWRRRT